MTRAYRPRILLTGITSIHGWPLLRALESRYGASAVFGLRPPRKPQPAGVRYSPVCLGDRETLRRLRERWRPDWVVHAGGVCDLDVCEERPEWAHRRNVGGARALLDVFGGSCRFVYLSTDLVFSGENPPPQGYREDDPTEPVSVVGKTYRLAEQVVSRSARHLILRLGLPMGASIQGKKGAVDWIESRFRRGLPVTLFHDERRSAIDCEEAGRLVVGALEANLSGLYHLGGPHALSLYEIGRRLLARGNYDPALLKTCSRRDEVDGPPRAGNVALDSSRLEEELQTRVEPCAWDSAGGSGRSAPRPPCQQRRIAR